MPCSSVYGEAVNPPCASSAVLSLCYGLFDMNLIAGVAENNLEH